MNDFILPLFDLAPTNAVPASEVADRKPRTEDPRRAQGKVRFDIPDELIAEDHRARLLWNMLGATNLIAFGASSRSVEGHAGRSLKSPRMLLTLWLYAISVGVGSAREISRLTKTDVAYRWIVGDVDVGHHKLSQFRVGHGEALSNLMTEVLAILMTKKLLSLDLVAQDGTRTRAAATAPSFRTYGSLLECRAQAALHLKAVLATSNDPEHTRMQHARRAAAAQDYGARVEAAIAAVKQLQEGQTSEDKPARASTTDAEARIMKMGDGGFRPAFNVQYAVAGSEVGGPRTIVGVQVSNVGSDMGSLAPMAEQILERTGDLPKTLLADGGYAKIEDIMAVRAQGVDVLVPPSKNARSILKLVEAGADPKLIDWRMRMETPEAQTLYRARASLCELSNALQKSHHGISQFLVRGVEKVTCVILLHVVASNLLQHVNHLAG